jgi:hypothetical protein
MMSDRDEAVVTAELRALPPQWVLWVQNPSSFWLEAWPHTDPARLRFPAIESFLETNYRTNLRIAIAGGMLVLMREKSFDQLP